MGIQKAFVDHLGLESARGTLANRVAKGSGDVPVGYHVVRRYMGKGDESASPRGEAAIREAISALKQSGRYDDIINDGSGSMSSRKKLTKQGERIPASILKAFGLVTALVLVFAITQAAWAQPIPATPGGSPPHGYTRSGDFFVPREGAQEAIPLPPNGTCAWGWLRSGNYCLRSGDSR
jgi:hypothetical protein